jgi:AcrR family transcriptional regulator
VLDAALAIAVTRGPAAVSMTALAEHLGVTKPVVYACFATRDEVLRALLDREERRLLDGVLAAVPTGGFDDPKRLLIEGFTALLRTVDERPDSWRIVYAAQADPTIAERFGRGRILVARRVGELMRPALRGWGTTDAERKLPVLVEIFMATGEAAVRQLLAGSWTPETLGELVGTTTFHALRNA